MNFFRPTRVFHAPKISQHKIIVFFFRFSFRFGSVVIRTHDYVRVNEISDDKNVLSFPRIVHLKLFTFFLFSFVESCFRFMFETFECVYVPGTSSIHGAAVDSVDDDDVVCKATFDVGDGIFLVPSASPATSATLCCCCCCCYAIVIESLF